MENNALGVQGNLTFIPPLPHPPHQINPSSSSSSSCGKDLKRGKHVSPQKLPLDVDPLRIHEEEEPGMHRLTSELVRAQLRREQRPTSGVWQEMSTWDKGASGELR